MVMGLRRYGALGFVAALAAAVPVVALAGASDIGKIQNIHIMPDGTVLFYQHGPRTSAPGCATIPNRWQFDGATPLGQARLSILLTAYAAGKSIVVNGAGACSPYSDSETVAYFGIADY